jgi:hypothetical protein
MTAAEKRTYGAVGGAASLLLGSGSELTHIDIQYLLKTLWGSK